MMSFGEWCATVGLVIVGAAATAIAALFIFVWAFRWPIIVLAAAIFIAKNI